ncbi:MAG: class I SAM-dependent methyltransferase, partial [Burkholderiales bacterium]
RRWADVTSTDYVPALLERGRARAGAEGLPVKFEQADVENLQYPDASFDVVLSTFGVMFTPDQEKAAAEMARVCKPGGKIGLANWTPSSFVGELFKLIGRYLPPPAGVKSPALWGTEERLRALFGDHLGSIAIEPKDFVFRYRSAAHFLEVFRTYYGPVHKAFGALDAEKQESLAADLIALAERFNRATDGSLLAPGRYVEVVIQRK